MAEVRPHPAPRCDLPRGYGAPIAHLGQWEDVQRGLRGAQTKVVLPRIDAQPTASESSLIEQLSNAQASVLRIDRWTEAMGGLEARLGEWAEGLSEGSSLLMDLHHAMAPTRARESFEGRSGSFHPKPAPAERELDFDIRRLVWALCDHGFVVEDLVEVCTWEADTPRVAIEALLKAGFAPTRRLYSMPGERLWLRARRARVCAGSLLLACRPGQGEALERSRRAIQSWLPASWEIVVGDVHESEIESWNSAVTNSCGEVLFFLRPGDAPDEALFESLWSEVCYQPVRVAQGQGSLGMSGVMVDRATAFEIGPLPREIESTLVAGEEWVLRGQCCGRDFREIALDEPSRNKSLFAPAPSHASDAHEARGLQERWALVNELKDPGAPEANPVPEAPWVSEDREPFISLCMIARNEEKDLPRCLERVKDHVDEIVLVDTGSTDRTVEIAKDYGARILHRAWDDDFSAPRNLALAEAKGDWILVLDADEVVAEASLPLIRDLCKLECASGYHMRFFNDHESGRSHGITMVRLFRNLPGIHYENAIHEQVIPSLMKRAEAMNLLLLGSRIEVMHYGYSDEQMTSKGKVQRNLALFEKQLEREPEDVYTLYKYGDFLRQIEAPCEEILAVFRRGLDLMLVRPPRDARELPYAGEVCALLALELAKLGQHVEADRIVRTGLSRFMPTPNLHYIAAGLALQLGRHEEALAHYRCCLDFRGRSLVVPVQEGSDSWIAFAGMGECWFKKGEWDRAEALFRRSVRLAPQWEVGVMRLSSFLLGTERSEEALALLRDYLESERERGVVRYQGALILEHLERYAQAASWYELALDSGDAPRQTCAQQAGACYLLIGDPQAARRMWEQLGADEIAEACLALLDRIEDRSAPHCEPMGPRARVALERMKNFLEKTGHAAWAAHAGDLLVEVPSRVSNKPSVPLGSRPDPLLARK